MIWIQTNTELFSAKHFLLNEYGSGDVYITTTQYTAPRSIKVPSYEAGQTLMEMIARAVRNRETYFDARRALAELEK